MNTLFGMALPRQIQWAERDQARLHASARHTLTGGLVLAARGGFQPVTLVAERDTCWITPAEAEAFIAHAMANPTAVGELIWNGTPYTATWRHDADGGAVHLQPLWPFAAMRVGELRLYVLI